MRVYFDYNATTPLAPDVVEAVSAATRDLYGNASSVHHFGQQAKAALDEARGQVAALIGADASEIVFTAGGTESDNIAIRGAADALEPSGRKHLVTSAIEHEAVLNTMKALARRGWIVTTIPVDESGIVSVDRVREAITDRTALVSVMHANNEIGTVQPIAETENGAALVAFGVGAAVPRQKMTTEGPRLAALRDRLEAGVLGSISGSSRNGAASPRVPNTTNISIERIESESVLIGLDLAGIAVSSGSACSSGTLEPSHVLKAMGLSHLRTLG